MNNEQVGKYLKSWFSFRKSCEIKAKNRCLLNNNAWRKLEEWHLEKFLNEINNPFGFLYKLKIFNPEIYYRVYGISALYKKKLEDRKVLIRGRRS